MPSTPRSTCSSHNGISFNDHKSFTKIIKIIVIARSRSIAVTLWTFTKPWVLGVKEVTVMEVRYLLH
jgi:hypothetical protein